MKKQFGQFQTPVCKAPIKMSQPCNRKILFVQFEKCMYAIQKPPFSASPNLTFCYRYRRLGNIMLHHRHPATGGSVDKPYIFNVLHSNTDTLA